MIFKGNMKKIEKLNLAKFATYEALIYKNIFHRNFLNGTRNTRK